MSSSVDGLEARRVCTYQLFDTETLESLSNETTIRIEEVTPILDAVRGKSVLDIGCNAGLFSLLAARAGAQSVHSIDVDSDLIERLSATAAFHDLPISAERKAFWELTKSDAAEVCFAFEVVHWLVEQGAELPNIAAHLRLLTRKVMYLETPWDSTEPSIEVGGIVSRDMYSARALISELRKVGFTVERLYFSKYFTGSSKRVMLVARLR